MFAPLFAFPTLGMGELMVLGLFGLLIFGNRLPSTMRSLGKSIVEFKRGMTGADDDVDPALPPEPKPTTSAKSEKIG